MSIFSFLLRKLEDIGVKICSPTGGFYMFPDFEVLRDSLKQMGIETCHQMCKHLLDEKGIAVSSYFNQRKDRIKNLFFYDVDKECNLYFLKKLIPFLRVIFQILASIIPTCFCKVNLKQTVVSPRGRPGGTCPPGKPCDPRVPPN